MYTSPHLIHPEERIRINSVPIKRDSFSRYFFEAYDRLPQLHSEYDPTKDPVARGPRNLQIYALLALHTFIREGVDIAIFETHSGGEYDATNVITKPVVAAVTTLGMDHIAMLGPTIENIAWHKAGIYKRGAVCLSARQDPAPAAVLRERAQDLGETVSFVDEDSRLPADALQLKPNVQRQNASLALAAAEALVRHVSNDRSKSLATMDIQQGVRHWSWPGRFQIITQGSRIWYLDAAHNEMSVAIAAQWFAETALTTPSSGTITRVLVFSHVNETRDAPGVMKVLARALYDNGVIVDELILTSYASSDTNGSVAGKANNTTQLHEAWEEVVPTSVRTRVWEVPDIPAAWKLARQLGEAVDGSQILVTGSQHLIGPALQILQTNDER
jgi:folylpolyglutamate synthase